MKKLLSVFAVPLFAAALVLAQDQPPVSSTDKTGERTESTVPRRTENRDWGWIGLFGLAGLAGLRRRHDVKLVRTEERSREYDAGGVRRAS